MIHKGFGAFTPKIIGPFPPLVRFEPDPRTMGQAYAALRGTLCAAGGVKPETAGWAWRGSHFH